MNLATGNSFSLGTENITLDYARGTLEYRGGLLTLATKPIMPMTEEVATQLKELQALKQQNKCNAKISIYQLPTGEGWKTQWIPQIFELHCDL